MTQLPTAEEFFKQEYERLNIKWVVSGELKSWRNEDVEILKNFAKLHVKKFAEENNISNTQYEEKIK